MKAVAKRNAKGATKLVAKASKVVKAAYKGLTGQVVLLVSGTKGEVYRLANVTKDGSAKLIQDIQKGLSYDGPTFNLMDAKIAKETRLHLGTYVAGKGTPFKIEVLSVAAAIARAKTKVKVERHNDKEESMKVTRLDRQYAASVETTKRGVRLFGQWESVKLGDRNKAHYGALVTSK